MTEQPFDLLNYPYSSRRTTTVANNGMVATSQPLASQAGLDILKQGGGMRWTPRLRRLLP